MERNVRIALRALLTAYVALLVGPMLPLVVPGPEWLLFAGGALVGAAGGYVLGRSDDPTRVVTRWRLGAATFLPLGYLLAVFPAVRADGMDGLLSPASVGVLACIPAYLAFLLMVAAENAHDPDENPTVYRFEARLAEDVRRRILAISLVIVVAGVATGYLLSTVDTGARPGLGLLTATVASVVVIVAVTRSRREVTVTEDGLVVQGRLREWNRFEGFSLDEDRLVVLSSDWWRTDVSFDTGDIENPREVYEALSRFLDRI